MKKKKMSKTKVVIACLSLKNMPTHPPEQLNCVQVECDACSENIWLSENKRNIMQKHDKDFVLMCTECAKEFAILSTVGFNVLDIKKDDHLKELEETLGE